MADSLPRSRMPDEAREFFEHIALMICAAVLASKLPRSWDEPIISQMNTEYLKSKCGSLAVWLAVAAFAVGARAAEPTAFDLIKEANRYVGEQSKDKVVQIRSEKSVGSLTPNIWYIVLYDSTATLKAQEVKFGAGKMISVKRPMRLLEPVTGG